jgi:hypothetical protein
MDFGSRSMFTLEFLAQQESFLLPAGLFTQKRSDPPVKPWGAQPPFSTSRSCEDEHPAAQADT